MKSRDPFVLDDGSSLHLRRRRELHRRTRGRKDARASSPTCRVSGACNSSNYHDTLTYQCNKSLCYVHLQGCCHGQQPFLFSFSSTLYNSHVLPLTILLSNISLLYRHSPAHVGDKTPLKHATISGTNDAATCLVVVATLFGAQACILQLFQAYHSESVRGQVYRVLTLVSVNIPLRAYQPCSVRNDLSSLTPRLTAPPQTDIPKNHALLLHESLALSRKSPGSSPPLTMGTAH
ncbi:hypothetical protein NC652_031185 [Populus alba x Populus x berolinensis]|nr:hypothetical protein NC652_031185 [Populus alba x Populus x berolinensis]